MKLVAQRVVSVTQGQKLTGINSRCYSHPGREWLNEPPDDLGEGELVNRHDQVRPGGNRVRSYLDIVAPDSTPNVTIEHSVRSTARFLAESRVQLPWAMSHADVFVEFNLEASLAAHWQIELETLLAHCLAVREETDLGLGTLSGTILDP
jgi:hypothetical protein